MNKLDQNTVKQLSSLQVIVSVSSVVKELIENSLDAKATSIEVKLEDYGLSKIEVRDNGCGIKSTDMPYIAQLHYTSKIATFADLYKNIQSYGFRGEALGSLCQIAELSVTTRTASDDVSQTYTFSRDGHVTSVKPSHLRQGTCVVVKNLFHNTPVRKAYCSSVKKQRGEMREVEKLLTTYSLVQCAVRFSLSHNNSIIMTRNATPGSRLALLAVVGHTTLAHMKHVSAVDSNNKFEIEAFLPDCSASTNLTSRSNNDYCFCYVNRRPVVLKSVDKLIRSYYTAGTQCEKSRLPIYFVHLTIAQQQLDVNVTPDKTLAFIEDEKSLLAWLDKLLTDLYGPICKPEGQFLANTLSPGMHHSTDCVIEGDEPPVVAPSPGRVIEEDAPAHTCLPRPHHSTESELPISRNTVEVPFSCFEKSNVANSCSSSACPNMSANLDAAFDDSLNCDYLSARNQDCVLSESSSSKLSALDATGLGEASALRQHGAVASVGEVSPANCDQTRPDTCIAQIGEENNSGLLCQASWSRGVQFLGKGDPVSILSTSSTSNSGVAEAAVSGSVGQNAPFSSTKPNAGQVDLSQFFGIVAKPQSNNQLGTACSAQNDLQCAKRKSPLHTVDDQAKKPKHEQNDLDLKKKQVPASPMPYRPKVSTVEWNWKSLCVNGAAKAVHSQDNDCSSARYALVGALERSSIWIATLNSHLVAFKPLLVRKATILRELMSHHALPVVSLPTPVQLTLCNLSSAQYDVLCHLNKSAASPQSVYMLVNDERLASNGFHIGQRTDCVELFMLGVHNTESIAMELETLRELLQLIIDNPTGELQHCRPQSVINFLKKEAQRMASQMPAVVSRDTASTVLQEMYHLNIDDNFDFQQLCVLELHDF